MHGLGNEVVLLLFAAGWLLCADDGNHEPGTVAPSVAGIRLR